MAARLIPPAGDGPLSGAAGGQDDWRVAWPARRATAARRIGVVVLALTVTLAHLGFLARMADTLAGWGAAAQMPERLRAVFTRELKAAAPTPVVQAPPARRQAELVQAPAPAASQPQRKPRRRTPEPPPREADGPDARADTVAQAERGAKPPPVEPAASEPQGMVGQTDLAASAPSASTSDTLGHAEREAQPAGVEPAASEPQGMLAQTDSAASAPSIADSDRVAAAALPAASAASAVAFEWPASTQLTYQLTGWYRGELYGSAQVEWIREGERYQVHLDVVIGLPIAPLMSRRMTSDGEITEQGLRPRRYDEETRVGFTEPRLLTIRFEPDSVLLPTGQSVARWPAVQDSVSQFVQLTWMFTLQPQLLRPGGTVDLALALPRYVDRWVFDVLGEETLYAPFGPVQTVHIKPRRGARPGIDRTAEIWIAPSLLYLPVRIRIWNDEQTYIDLVIERPPLQAETPSERQ
jgi:Protein of unknown function (DUF3108)